LDAVRVECRSFIEIKKAGVWALRAWLHYLASMKEDGCSILIAAKVAVAHFVECRVKRLLDIIGSHYHAEHCSEATFSFPGGLPIKIASVIDKHAIGWCAHGNE